MLQVRYGINSVLLQGERGSSDQEAANEWLAKDLPDFLAHYKMEDIFNLDETSLLGRATAERSLVEVKGAKVGQGHDQLKGNKWRLTLCLLCNMTGTEKFNPLIIGTAETPRCLRGIKPANYPGKLLGRPTMYSHNKRSGWMNSDLFTDYVVKFDK